MNRKTLFTTSIYEKLNFLNEDEIKNLVQYIKENEVTTNNNHFIGDVHCSFNPEPVGFLDNFKELKNKIEEQIVDCAKMIGYPTSLCITNSWYNVQKEGSQLVWHTHPNSLISGVIYLKTDRNSSKLYFSNPNPILKTVSFVENNSDNFDSYSIVPEDGLMLMWPSWMLHGSHTDINNSEERIAISFNTFYR